jgi:hypothetical protein
MWTAGGAVGVAVEADRVGVAVAAGGTVGVAVIATTVTAGVETGWVGDDLSFPHETSARTERKERARRKGRLIGHLERI